jgi:AcrR family transcriptional regulator
MVPPSIGTAFHFHPGTSFQSCQNGQVTPPPRKKPDRRATALSRDRIVDAAIALLDAEGEAGLTFRALSERLATGPGAIYWHVAGKSELLAAATDHIVTAALAPDPASAASTATAAAVSTSAAAAKSGHIHTVALSLYNAVEAHPWLSTQLAAQLSHNPSGPVTTRLFEAIGQQVSALKAPATSWFTATTALVHYILGAAGQNAANLVRARALGPEADRSAYLDSVATAWGQLSAEEHPFLRALADQGLDHDDRAQFLAGVDLIIAGVTDYRKP